MLYSIVGMMASKIFNRICYGYYMCVYFLSGMIISAHIESNLHQPLIYQLFDHLDESDY